MAPFTIVQVSWLTQLPGNDGRREEIVEHVYRVAKFLQDNALVTRELMKDRRDITDAFAISSGDLTGEGLAVMKAGYDKWLQKVDKGMDPSDITILDRALKRVRQA